MHFEEGFYIGTMDYKFLSKIIIDSDVMHI